jgi:HEAT repeat protein
VSGEEKYELLRNYLQRIARQKAGRNEIRNMLTFTGHGYHSESLASWEWDLLSLREQFPQLYKPGYSIKNLNHASSPHMKKIILTELQNPDLDMVVFHAHGSDDTQYLNGYPPARNTAENIRDVKLYLRSKLRQAKRWKRDPEEYKTYFIEKFGVPEDWFDGAFVDSVMTADSIYSADLDIYTSDLKGIQTQPKFVMFDECYNGQFTKTPYIAGKYIFSGGNTIVTVANTVNVKQDIWANEFLGMLNLGLRAGEWHKTREFLESHLIGDPTFHFDAAVPEKLVDNLYKDRSEKFWLEQLQHEAPVRRSIAVAELFRLQKYQFIDDLVDIYRQDPAFIVRLQALRCLSETRSKAFEDILLLTAKDPAEMIRRITTIWMGRIGREDYLPVLAELMLHDHSDRVSRQAEESMEFIDPDKALQTAGQMIEKLPEIADREMLRESVLKGFERSHDWLYNDLLGTLQSDTMSVKEKKGAVRTFRNYTFHNAVDELCELALNENADLSLRVNVVETLGWFTFSQRRDEIIKTCDLLLAAAPLDDKLRAETIKTKKRIIVGSNDPLVP